MDWLKALFDWLKWLTVWAILVSIAAGIAYILSLFAPDEPDDPDPELDPDVAEQLEREEITSLEDLRELSPRDFEKFLGWHFERQGFEVEVTKPRGDHGVDLVLQNGESTIVVQAKRYSGGQNIGEPAIRAFYGSFEDFDADEGYFITTSAFTRAAREWAEKPRQGMIHMIDGGKLEEWLSR